MDLNASITHLEILLQNLEQIKKIFGSDLLIKIKYNKHIDPKRIRNYECKNLKS